VDPGLRDVQGVRGEARPLDVRRLQEAVSAAEAEEDRGERTLPPLLSASAGARLLVERQGAQLRGGWLQCGSPPSSARGTRAGPRDDRAAVQAVYMLSTTGVPLSPW
jgi:hypothetical protein